MKTQTYKITAVTNLQAGSGSTSYSVVDNLVQRDPASGIPCIYGSSIKGAIKEFYSYKWDKDDPKIAKIFGDKDTPSNYKFIAAQLLAIPLRSNVQSYFLATCPRILNDAMRMANNLGTTLNLKGLVQSNRCKFIPKDNRPILFRAIDETTVIEDFEDFEVHASMEENIIGHLVDIVLLSDADFITMTNNNHLPVIARNRMDGERNLWYEQVVPREAIFLSSIFYREETHWKEFDDVLSEENNLIHIGANATVGYGFTKFEKIKL